MLRFSTDLHISYLACAVIAFATAPLAAQGPLLRREPVAAPLKFKEGAFLERDFKKQERAWADTHLLVVAKARWQGQPWAAEAEKFCTAALDTELLGLWKDQEYGALAPDASKLLSAGCTDPLVAWLAWLELSKSRGNWRDGESAMDVMCTTLPDPARVSGALGMFIGREHLALSKKRSKMTESEEASLADAILRALSDDSYDEASEPILVRQVTDAVDALDPTQPQTLAALLRSVEQSRYSPWAKYTLQGFIQKHAAWAQRGDGWAASVTDAGWKGFAAHLALARQQLEAAWKLRPDRPEPAAFMITVSMGEGSDLMDQRAWFDKATGLQPDYYWPYRSFLYAALPRWNGSHEVLAQIGAACADTARYDTWVPYEIFECAAKIGEEKYDAHKAFTAFDFGSGMRRTIEGYLSKEGLTGKERRFYASFAAVAAYLRHEPDLCARALEMAGPKLEEHAVAMLHRLLSHEVELRAETAALVGKSGAEARDLMLTAYKRDRNALLDFLKRTKTDGLSPEAKGLFEQINSTVQFGEQLAKGGWVPLTFRPDLGNMGCDGGKWSGTNDGELILTGNDTKWGHCFLRIPIGSENMEVRGNITFDIPDKSVIRDGFGFGPMLGWLPDCMNGKPGANALIMNYGGGREEAHVSGNALNASTGRVASPFQNENTFLLCVYDGKVTFHLNDRVIAEAQPLDKIGVDDARGFVGFTSFRFPWGAKATVKNVEVRKSTAAPVSSAAPVVPAKKAAKPAQTSSAPSPAIVQTPSFSKPYFSKNWQLIVLIVLVVIAAFVMKFVRPAQD